MKRVFVLELQISPKKKRKGKKDKDDTTIQSGATP